MVQGLPSSTGVTGPGTHAPALQLSLPLHTSPSEHEPVLGAFTHPVAATHESSVQTFESLQLTGLPLAQFPPEQTSFPVQALPSEQGTVLFACVHPLAGLQASSVHTLPSPQLRGPPEAQPPPWHESPSVQASLSEHTEPFGFAGFVHCPVAGTQAPGSWH
jgi:hypothetical protein